MRRLAAPGVATLVPLLFTAGCGSPAPVEAPALDPDAAAARAMTDYDRNHDGYLDARELEACPALKSALKRLDKDGDGRLSKEEIAERLREFEDSRVGLFVTTARVVLDGKPLADATIQLEPEAFMGSSIKPSRGTTDALGRALPRIEGSQLPGCHYGFYRVRLSRKDASGNETIPAQYQNTLGVEVPNPTGGGIVFSLTSK
jgi:hypothetical protein